MRRRLPCGCRVNRHHVFAQLPHEAWQSAKVFGQSSHVLSVAQISRQPDEMAASALSKGAAGADLINSAEVYERDRWVCGICLERVDRRLIWPDPMSPSLDHIVPLSRGGAHQLANVQCAHLSCNVRKGARPET